MTRGRNDINEYFKCVAKIFIATLLILSLLAIGCGCSSSKKAEKSSTEISEKKSGSIINGISFDRKWFEKYLEISLSSNENTDIVIYDTSLPVDSFTNERPVLAKINKTKKTNASASESDNVKEETTEILSGTQNSDSISYKFDEEKNESVTKSGLPSWRIYIFALFVLASVFIALWGKHLIQDAAYWLLNKIFK